MADRDDILRKVQAIINKADSTNFDEERDALLAKADELMFRYAIESYELDAQRQKSNRKEQIVKRVVELGRNGDVVTQSLIDLVSTIAAHARCRMVVSGAWGNATVSAILVGFESDTEYVEMLYTSLYLEMAKHLEPKPDPNLSYEENVVMLLMNGTTRKRAAELLGVDLAKTHSRMSALYKQYCLENDIPYQPKGRPRGNTYLVNFSRGFVSKIATRLWEIRKARGETSSGTELALVDRKKEVDDALKDFFPDLGTLRRKNEGKFNAAARSRGEAAGAQADLNQTRVAAPNSKALPN